MFYVFGGISYKNVTQLRTSCWGFVSNFKLIYKHLFTKIIFEKEITCIRAYLNCNFFFFFLEIVIRAQHGANFEFKHTC